MKINNYTSFYSIDFGAKTYSQRVQERLRGSDWWDRNFGGDEESARNNAEREMLEEIDTNLFRKRAAENNYERYVENYNYQSNRNSNRMIELDNEIKKERNLHTTQIIKINKLDSKIASQSSQVSRSNELLEEIEANTNTIRENVLNIEQESHKLKTKLRSIKTQTEETINEQTRIIQEQTKEEYNQKLDNLTQKPMLYLNQNLILPLKVKQIGKDFTVPNGLLIEAPIKLYSKIILTWITKKTNSNYAKLNAKKFKTETDFFEALSNISEQAKKNNQESNKHTFTLITNIEKFTQNKDAQIIPYLKSFMDTTSKDYNNTIILTTKNVSKLDSILTAKHRFPLKMNLSWNDSLIKKYGFWSMLFDCFRLKVNRTKIKPNI